MDNSNVKQWEDDDRFYSSSHSDDSPILSYRHNKYRRHEQYSYESKAMERERRSTFTVLAKVLIFCTAMILFCVLMYIPVYNKANYQVTKGVVEGWSVHTNRDTRIYVQPNNVTTIHEPSGLCPRNKSKRLYLLIVVCSATHHYEKRNAIRETWGSYKNYTHLSKVFNDVRLKYKQYNFTYDLYPIGETKRDMSHNVTEVKNVTRTKRGVSSFGNLFPELAKALKKDLVAETGSTPEVPEQRFEDEAPLPEFDMNEVIGDHTEEASYDYNYDTNIMKIPPRGYEETGDLDKVMAMLKKSKALKENVENLAENDNTEPDFRIVFLLGLPSGNSSDLQEKIEEESKKYGDIIQEGFIDSYNNLTLKSIMMLKWVTNKCNDSVRYILKTDDDMYVNVPNLILNLRNRSRVFDEKTKNSTKEKEYLLIGDLICGARPVLDRQNKWYTPKYMYNGRLYPRYLSGTGYALSAPTAAALYDAALRTPYFHLEDIYITGICAARASPRVVPRDEPLFSYESVPPAEPWCAAQAHATAHRVPPHVMRSVHRRLLQPAHVDRCERKRLTQVRRERMRPKKQPKKKSPTKLGLAMT